MKTNNMVVRYIQRNLPVLILIVSLLFLPGCETNNEPLVFESYNGWDGWTGDNNSKNESNNIQTGEDKGSDPVDEVNYSNIEDETFGAHVEDIATFAEILSTASSGEIHITCATKWMSGSKRDYKTNFYWTQSRFVVDDTDGFFDDGRLYIRYPFERPKLVENIVYGDSLFQCLGLVYSGVFYAELSDANILSILNGTYEQWYMGLEKVNGHYKQVEARPIYISNGYRTIELNNVEILVFSETAAQIVFDFYYNDQHSYYLIEIDNLNCYSY